MRQMWRDNRGATSVMLLIIDEWGYNKAIKENNTHTLHLLTVLADHMRSANADARGNAFWKTLNALISSPHSETSPPSTNFSSAGVSGLLPAVGST